MFTFSFDTLESPNKFRESVHSWKSTYFKKIRRKKKEKKVTDSSLKMFYLLFVVKN